jgi:hypothetical protein
MEEILRMVLGDTALAQYQIEIPEKALARHKVHSIDDICTGKNILKKIEEI